MSQTVTVALTVPLSEVGQLLTLLQTLKNPGDEQSDTRAGKAPPRAISALDATQLVPSEVLEFDLVVGRPKLTSLLDERLRRVVSSFVEHEGTLLNKDLAATLNLDRPALTSNPLGHLTRKLRKAGVLGTNERDWYTKHSTPNGTLLTARGDVMEKFRETLKQ